MPDAPKKSLDLRVWEHAQRESITRLERNLKCDAWAALRIDHEWDPVAAAEAYIESLQALISDCEETARRVQEMEETPDA